MNSAKKRVIGIVPARSGSKGLPGKNIRMLGDKHLMGWAIETGKKSGVLDEIFIMTDSAEYAEIAKSYGASAPFLEADEYATDTSHVFQAMKWYLGELDKKGMGGDYVVLLEPSAPGRQAEHIQKLVELVLSSGADAGFTVTEVPAAFNAHWQIAVDHDGRPHIATSGVPFKNVIRRKQQLPQLFMRGGSTYVSKTEFLMKEDPDMYGDDPRVLVVDRKYLVDLDTEEDWREAERTVPGLHTGK